MRHAQPAIVTSQGAPSLFITMAGRGGGPQESRNRIAAEALKIHLSSSFLLTMKRAFPPTRPAPTASQTASPREEISEGCKTGGLDDGDLTYRVFKQKVDVLIDVVCKNHVIGRCDGYCYTIEWQKVSFLSPENWKLLASRFKYAQSNHQCLDFLASPFPFAGSHYTYAGGLTCSAACRIFIC